MDTKDADLRHRPIYGGIFGRGRYALASMPCVMRGLHAVRFMVIDPVSGAVLSLRDEKVEALNAARKVLTEATLALLSGDGDSTNFQGELWSAEEVPRPIIDRHRPVSRRRRDIFAKCCGACHYCATPLILDGAWHIEHMMPRALGGTDDPLNLVASCVPCNLAKRDRTAVEFVLEQVRA